MRILYNPLRKSSGAPINNRMVAGAPEYLRPTQQLYSLPGWGQLSLGPIEGRIMVDWKTGQPLLTQAGAADRNEHMANIYLREVV